MPKAFPSEVDFLWLGWGVGALVEPPVDVDVDPSLSNDEIEEASSAVMAERYPDVVAWEALILRGTGGSTFPGSSFRSYGK